MPRPKWEQLPLFGGFLFGVNRRKKRIVQDRQVYKTGNYKTAKQPPLAVVYRGQRAARAKVDRARRKAG